MIGISNWKLIALDLDGTTLCPGGTVADSTREWLLRAREAGVPFTFATGRHWCGFVEKLVRELAVDVPVVTSNGAEVRTCEGEVLLRRGLAPESVAYLHQLAKEKGAHFWGATVDGAIEEADVPSDLSSLEWLKFGYHTTSQSAIDALWDSLRENEKFTLTNSHPLNMEVNAAGVTKATALEHVCEMLSIEPKQTVCMGDSLNDVQMLKFAGLGIAMGNAQDAVKDVAHWVTRSCEEDGVGYAVALKVLGVDAGTL